jgi:hypothetical protein
MITQMEIPAAELKGEKQGEGRYNGVIPFLQRFQLQNNGMCVCAAQIYSKHGRHTWA